MSEPEKDLAEKLRQALPQLTGREEFRRELRDRILKAEPGRVRRSEFPLRLSALGGIAAVLLLVFLAAPALIPRRKLATLPPLTATGPETQGAAAGPGFTAELSYSLAGELGDLPEEALVYRHGPMSFSPEEVRATAAKLGITGEVTAAAWQDKIIYQIGTAGGRMLIAFPDGYTNYYRPLPENIGNELPPEPELQAAAAAFISQLGFDPGEMKLRNVEYPESDEVPATASFFYGPVQPENVVGAAPYFQVTAGADGEIYGAGWIWPAGRPQTAAYPVRKAAAAWAAVQSGRGELVIDYRDIPGPAAGTTVSGQGKVDDVTIAYLLTYADTGEVVLQPVAAFRGTAVLEDGTTLPFTVYTEAVDAGYYEDRG